VRRLTVALATVLLLVGCSGVPRSSPGPVRSSTAPSTSPSTGADTAADTGAAGASTASRSPAPVPPPPRRDACYLLTMNQLTRPTNASRPVACGSQHNTRTIYVGRLSTVVDGHAVAVDSDTVQHQLATTCPRRLDAYVGGSRTARDLSRFRVVWFSPTVAQSDAGADWFR